MNSITKTASPVKIPQNEPTSEHRPVMWQTKRTRLTNLYSNLRPEYKPFGKPGGIKKTIERILTKEDFKETSRIAKERYKQEIINKTLEQNLEDKIIPVLYKGPHFYMYNRSNLTHQSYETNIRSLELKQESIYEFLSTTIPWENNQTLQIYNEICTLITPILPQSGEYSGRTVLRDCIKYAGIDGYNVIIKDVIELHFDISFLEFICATAIKYNTTIYFCEVYNGGLLSLNDYLTIDEFRDRFSKIQEDYIHKLAIVAYETKLYDIIMSETVINKKYSTISLPERQPTLEDKDAHRYDKSNTKKRCDKWTQIYIAYYEIGLYDWICEHTGGEDDFDVKRWKRINKSVSKLRTMIKWFEDDDRFPIWNGKKKYTDSMISRTKRNIRNMVLDGFFDDPKIAKPYTPIMEIDEERLGWFTDDLGLSEDDYYKTIRKSYR